MKKFVNIFFKKFVLSLLIFGGTVFWIWNAILGTVSPYVMANIWYFGITNTVFIILCFILNTYFLTASFLKTKKQVAENTQSIGKVKTKIWIVIGIAVIGLVSSFCITYLSFQLPVQALLKDDKRFISAYAPETYCDLSGGYKSDNQYEEYSENNMKAKEFSDSITLENGEHIYLRVNIFESDNPYMAKLLFQNNGGYAPDGMPPDHFFVSEGDEVGFERLEDVSLGYFFFQEMGFSFFCQVEGVFMGIEVSTYNANVDLAMKENAKEICMEQFKALSNQ